MGREGHKKNVCRKKEQRKQGQVREDSRMRMKTSTGDVGQSDTCFQLLPPRRLQQEHQVNLGWEKEGCRREGTDVWHHANNWCAGSSELSLSSQHMPDHRPRIRSSVSDYLPLGTPTLMPWNLIPSVTVCEQVSGWCLWEGIGSSSWSCRVWDWAFSETLGLCTMGGDGWTATSKQQNGPDIDSAHAHRMSSHHNWER